MNTVLPWHREAADEVHDEIWSTDGVGRDEIAAIVARHDPHAETLRLLEEAVEHIDSSAEYARQQSWTLTAELHRMKANQIRAHLAAMKGTR